MCNNNLNDKNPVGFSRPQSGGYRELNSVVESEEPEATRQDTTPPATFVRASEMPRDSTTGDIEARVEGAIKQLSIAAEHSDEEWFTVAIAEVVADLERLWALEEGFEYVGGER